MKSAVMSALVAGLSLAASCVGAQTGEPEWPEYRGPARTGAAVAKGLPTAWSETSNVVWKTPVHGRGWSTPVVYGQRLWLTTATEDGKAMSVLCLDRQSGKVLLDKVLFQPASPGDFNPTNSWASPSPVAGRGRVVVHFGTHGTACFDNKTLAQIWQRTDLNCNHMVGPGSSPLLVGDRLYLTYDGTDTQRTYCLNLTTGATVWMAERTGGPAASVAFDRRKCFNTPVLAGYQGKQQLICQAAMGVFAYDPATGQEIWRVRHGGYSNASRTLVDAERVYVSTGFDSSHMLAIRLGGSGDVTATHVAWELDRGMPSKPSPILLGDRILVIADSGTLTCLEAATGKAVYKERLTGTYSSSPILADGRIYLFSEQGRGYVLDPGPEFKVIAESELPEGCMASPVAVGKTLFVRTKAAVYRIEAK